MIATTTTTDIQYNVIVFNNMLPVHDVSGVWKQSYRFPVNTL